MKVKNYIPAKEPIQVEIYIPNPIRKERKEIQIIRRLLKLSTTSIRCEVEIEMKILTVPIELLFSCDNFRLEYKNENYYLKTDILISGEKLIFNIQNYVQGENLIVQTRIESLKGNNSSEPKINF